MQWKLLLLAMFWWLQFSPLWQCPLLARRRPQQRRPAPPHLHISQVCFFVYHFHGVFPPAQSFGCLSEHSLPFLIFECWYIILYYNIYYVTNIDVNIAAPHVIFGVTSVSFWAQKKIHMLFAKNGRFEKTQIYSKSLNQNSKILNYRCLWFQEFFFSPRHGPLRFSPLMVQNGGCIWSD